MAGSILRACDVAGFAQQHAHCSRGVLAASLHTWCTPWDPGADSHPPYVPLVTAFVHRYGESITIRYNFPKKVDAVTIIPPGANTHSLNMMQRLVYLRITSVTANSVTAQLPSEAARLANPGYYMLWVVSDDAPAREARWIKLAA